MADIAIQLQASQLRTVGASADATLTQANNGTAFTIKVRTIDYRTGLGLEDSPYIGGTDATFTRGVAHVASTMLPVLVLKGVFNITNSTDRDAIGYIDTLSKSKGITYLKTTDDSSNRTFIRFIREGASTATINVRVKDFTVKQRGTSQIVDYTLTLVETT